MRALKIERVRIDSLFFTPHNYPCLDISVTVRQHHIIEAIAGAATSTSTAPTTLTCNTSFKRLNYRSRWLGGAGGDGEAIVIEASIFCYFNFRIKEK